MLPMYVLDPFSIVSQFFFSSCCLACLFDLAQECMYVPSFMMKRSIRTM